MVEGEPDQLRRTMTLAGALLARQPYHWAADLFNPDQLMTDTFTQRMAGGIVASAATEALFEWLDGLRPVRATVWVDPATLELGARLFDTSGCSQCHSGPALSDRQIHVVRAASFEPVKSATLLGVGTREELFHDGCAHVLEDRFGPACDSGLGDHGDWRALTPRELEALTAYVRTL
jgi:hypothetical protein